MKIKHDKPVISQTKTYFCNAYGCKLNASIGLGTDGTGNFYCRFHYGSNPQKNDFITLEISKNSELVNFLDMALRPELFFVGLFDDQANQTLKKGLRDLGLEHLWDNTNYKTSKNIMGELNHRFRIDKDKEISKQNIKEQFSTMHKFINSKTFK
jgi:hypothetical protein